MTIKTFGELFAGIGGAAHGIIRKLGLKPPRSRGLSSQSFNFLTPYSTHAIISIHTFNINAFSLSISILS